MKPCFSIESITEGTGGHFYRYGYGYGYGCSVRVLGTGTGVWYGCWARVLGTGTGVEYCWVRLRELVLGTVVGCGYRCWAYVWVRAQYLCTVPMNHAHVPCHRTHVRYSSTVPPYPSYPCTVPMYRTHRTHHTYPVSDRSSNRFLLKKIKNRLLDRSLTGYVWWVRWVRYMGTVPTVPTIVPR